MVRLDQVLGQLQLQLAMPIFQLYLWVLVEVLEVQEVEVVLEAVMLLEWGLFLMEELVELVEIAVLVAGAVELSL